MNSTLWFIFYQSDLLIVNVNGQYSVPSREECPVHLAPWDHIRNIAPLNDGTKVKTVCLSAPPSDLIGGEMCGLRQTYYKLPKDLYDKAGQCQEINYWDKNTRFCGVCGGMMKLHTDISKRCCECGKEVWPQLATAVITIVTRGDEVLLVKGLNFKRDFHGLVAGFVETAETLEEAARREIREETGIEVRNIRYISSQPWPYPCGLMIGFHAEYVSGEIKIQKEELKDAAWFHRDALPTLPEPLSIARQLIDKWINNEL